MGRIVFVFIVVSVVVLGYFMSILFLVVCVLFVLVYQLLKLGIKDVI